MKHNEINDDQITKIVAQQLENLFNVYERDNGQYYYNITRTVNFPDDLDPRIFFEYVVVAKDTYPLISWKHYKSVKLWWIVCAVNNIENPVALPPTGTVLKMLRVDVVRDVLSELEGA